MIHTVLGSIEADKLGVTLMHEHVSWDPDGADSTRTYDIDEVVDTMLPYLLDLKNCGCQTLVEATTAGAGRDVEILRRCSEKSGINIVTNSGAWDGGDTKGIFVPEGIRSSSIDEIVDIWSSEFFNGIDGTKSKPGFIKIALGDTGEITELQEKLLRAAARTSKQTNMPIQCHSFKAEGAVKAVRIIEEENLAYNKFIWVHADGGRDFNVTKSLAEKGIWVEYDCLARMPNYEEHVGLMRMTFEAGIQKQLLLSQDAGCYYYGEKNDETMLFPFARIFKEFIPLCLQNGLTQKDMDLLLVENPKKVLDI